MAKVRALRRMRYGTRMMSAGDEFEASRRDAKLLTAIKHAEVVAPAAEPQRRTRRTRREEPSATEEPVEQQEMEHVPEPAAEETPETEAAADVPDDLADRTRDELLAMAAERGVELPGGYVRKDELVELLRGEDGAGSGSGAIPAHAGEV